MSFDDNKDTSFEATGDKPKPEDYLAQQVGRHLKPGGIQTFFLYRWEDVSGVSGTGVVAEGVRFGNGKCAVTWRGPVKSVTVYDSVEEVVRIHLHGGKTGLFWLGSQLNPDLVPNQVKLPSQAAYNWGAHFQVEQMHRDAAAGNEARRNETDETERRLGDAEAKPAWPDPDPATE